MATVSMEESNWDPEELHRLYDAMTIGVCIVDRTKKERILFVNKRTLALYDCGSEAAFLDLTGGKFAGMTMEEDLSLASARGSRQNFFTLEVQYLTSSHDTRGHEAGDALICTIAEILLRFSDKEHVFRMGWDEFLLIEEGMDEAGARDLVKEIQNVCAARGCSIALGYTVHTGPLDDIDAVLRRADQAMYRDKAKSLHRRSTDPKE